MSENAPVTSSEPTGSSSNESDTSSNDLSSLEQAVTEPTAEQIRKYKVKIDNQELDVDEAELIKSYQLGKSSQKRFHEAAQMRQQAEELISLAKRDPRALLSHPSIGHDIKKFAEQILSEQIQEQMMSPEEKERRDLMKRLETFENEKKSKEEAERTAQEQALYERHQQDYSTKIMGALDTSGLPKTENTVKKMAYYMLQAHNMGYDVSPADVVDLVKKDYLNDIKQLFNASNEDVLLQLLGDDVTNKVVKGHLNKVKKSQPAKAAVVLPPSVVKKADNSRKIINRDEWKQMLDTKTGK